MEIFKEIPNFPDYMVSNLGNVKSLARIIQRENNSDMRQSERILKTSFDDSGYKQVNLYLDKKANKKRIHQLVAMAFLGHKPSGHSLIVDHIDNDPSNNNLENLQLTTPRINTSKDRKGGTSKYIGVSWSMSVKKWMTSIRINSKQTCIGYFKCELAAAKAYQDKLKEIC